MRRIVIVLILSGLALNTLGQKTFVPILETFKRAYQSGVKPPGILNVKMFNDTLHVSGWIDSAALWKRSGNNYILGPMVRNAENMVQIANETLFDGPDFPMTSSGTMVQAHEMIYGKQYASTDGTSFPNSRVLDPATNQFIDIPGIHFNYGYFTQMYEMGNDEMVFIGRNGSMGSVNDQQIVSPVLWNQRTNVMRQTYCMIDGVKVLGMPWCIRGFKLNDTVYLAERFGDKAIVGLGPNSDTWVYTKYGALPGWDIDYVEAIDGIVYIIVKYSYPNASNYVFRLYRFKNNGWEYLMDMHPSYYGTVLYSRVLGMVKHDNKIAIAALVDTVNGRPTNGFFYYDPGTGAVSDIAPLPSGVSDVLCSGLFAPGNGNLYLAGWNGRSGIGLEGSTLYVLRNSAPNAPVITTPTGTVGTTSVTVSGTCEADTSIQITVYEGQAVIGTAKADNTGKWSFTYTASEGSHTIYAFATRPEAEQSSQSAAVSFTVHINHAPTVVISDTLIVSQATSATITGTASDPDGDNLTYRWTQNSGPTTATIANDRLLSTTVSNLSEGTYRFRLTVTDPGGLTASQTMTVQVSFITSVPPVIQNGTVVLYPNPTASSLHMKGVTKVFTVHNMVGQQLGVLQENVGNETVLQVYHYPVGTYFVTFEYTGRKTATAAFRVVR